jgi:integrase/recombinase XerD
MRRALGFELREVAGCLRHFVTFLESNSASYITTELALRWATRSGATQPSTWAWRLDMVRRFAVWLSAAEPRTEIPAVGLLPYRYQRKRPHIFSDEEIEQLLGLAAKLASPKGLRAPTYATLFALLAVSGMRVNEAVKLDRLDVDFEHGVLTVRRTKFGKSRYVPVHPSTVEALQQYADVRDRIMAKPVQAFFVSECGTRITDCMARYTFARLSQQLGLRSAAQGHGRGPRLHDLRHRFAARTLIHWYRSGLDVERELPKLATYLGHVHSNETYWYLEAVPELLQLATERVLNSEKEGRP